MSSDVAVEAVLSGTEATFHFTPPLLVMFLYVYDEQGGLVWRLASNEVSKVPAGQGIFISTPLAEAPPELVAAARAAQRNAIASPRENGASQVSLESIRYGVVPEGYQEEAPAPPLAAGGYLVRVVARNAHADFEFDVPNA